MPKYDLAVVGAGLGGLAAAALFSRKNKRTIVLEPGGEVGGAAAMSRKDGFTFFTGPALSFGFERGGELSNIYADLGIAHNASVISPCYQVLFPDRRINIYAENTETIEELGREFPKEIDAITKFYRNIRKTSERIAKSGFYAYQAKYTRASRFVKRYRFSVELTQFFNVQSLYFFQQPLEKISLTFLVLLLDSTPQYMRGGFMKLAFQMRDVILRSGGEIRYAEPWPEILGAKGGAASLMTKGGLLEADIILFNTQQETRDYALFIGLKDEVIPVGMAHELLCAPDYSQPDDLFYLSLSGRDDETAAPKGMRALTATRKNAGSAPEIKYKLFARITHIIPFLKDYLVFVQEHRPASRSYPFPPGIKFKPLRFKPNPALISKSSYKNVFLLRDDIGTPSQAVYAAQKLAERWM